jgi:hypothetical protein
MNGMDMTAGERKYELMSPDELAERLGVALRMVREMYYTNTWPHLRLNKRTVHCTEHLHEQILELSERRPATAGSRGSVGQRDHFDMPSIGRDLQGKT